MFNSFFDELEKMAVSGVVVKKYNGSDAEQVNEHRPLTHWQKHLPNIFKNKETDPSPNEVSAKTAGITSNIIIPEANKAVSDPKKYVDDKQKKIRKIMELLEAGKSEEELIRDISREQ